ncbi:MAG TPA: hypothetical protein VFP84_13185 [Kofleriaceae bacterium]|nr:hypothetical protein [Kofleriaceae bacterium]
MNLRAQLTVAELYATRADALVTDRDLIREVLIITGAPTSELDELVGPIVAEVLARSR